ncbi:MAG: hypothetical protein ACTSUQ_11315 [Candidatus Freyarchaeota archaeon]
MKIMLAYYTKDDIKRVKSMKNYDGWYSFDIFPTRRTPSRFQSKHKDAKDSLKTPSTRLAETNWRKP